MARRPSILPLETDGSGRFLPWLTALMVYLAALAIGGAMSLSGAIDRWDAGLAGTLTVQLPRPVDGTPLAAKDVNAALDALRKTPGIVSATQLGDDAQAQLLKPWLGDKADALSLPLPVLVDVHVADGAAIDTDGLQKRLNAIVPGAAVATHDRWLGRLFRVARAIEVTAFAIVALIAVAAVATIVFVVRTGLLIHSHVIDLLHMIGARDSFVARQFQWHAFRLGLRGGIIGVVAAALTIAAFYAVGMMGANGGEQAVMPSLGLTANGVSAAVILAVLLPFCAGGIGLLTARLTVLGALGRLP
ncbi:MAG TPA: cell division protein [Stellaceae bacterium]|nr:cell division protein [Stellaceae bacterium]